MSELVLEVLAELRAQAILDLTIVTLLLWGALVFLRRSRAQLALVGLLILGAIYLLARFFELGLTAWFLQGFFAVLVVILVVVFQEDLRRLFERIAVLGLRRKVEVASGDLVDLLARTMARLADTRTGALLVLPGREPVERHLEGGITLNARVSEPLLLSLFDASSPGHDGAVLLEGEVAKRFAVHLPLSTEHEKIGNRGTRHAAALGLTERCDALCVVVSEERGSISIARGGELRTLRASTELAGELRHFLAEVSPDAASRSRVRQLARHWPEAVAAVALASALWVVRVPGSELIEETRSVPVLVENLPPAYALDTVEPSEVQVTLSGTRRALFVADRQAVRVRVDALLVELGRRTFRVGPNAVTAPDDLAVLSVEPSEVRLSVSAKSGTAAAR